PVLDDLVDFHDALALLWVLQNKSAQIFNPLLDQIPAPIERVDVGRFASQKKTAMAAFQRGNVVLDHTAQAHHFDCVRSCCRLVMIAQRDVKKDAGKKKYDVTAAGGSGGGFKGKGV